VLKNGEVKRIRIINWKLSTMERDIAKNLIESKNMELDGVIDLNPNLLCKDVGEVLEKRYLTINGMQKHPCTFFICKVSTILPERYFFLKLQNLFSSFNFFSSFCELFNF